ncbi:MAG: NTP transferase domain-containing protein, partial [Verrucomicrobiae bacterium]|nr:NTP transferase domain-containing protein [Verrucomicrobiae bacterium]
VLVGGRSRRMGRDKAMLCYGEKPQAVVAYELLRRCCAAVFLSCRKGQVNPFGLPQVEDEEENLGPMAGILAALKAYPDKAWLVLACDLPFVTESLLRDLLTRRNPTAYATAYRSAHDGLPEPLCAIYEPTIAGKLAELRARGVTCPRRALQELAVPLLELPDPRALDNVNEPAEWEQARQRLEAARGARRCA